MFCSLQRSEYGVRWGVRAARGPAPPPRSGRRASDARRPPRAAGRRSSRQSAESTATGERSCVPLLSRHRRTCGCSPGSHPCTAPASHDPGIPQSHHTLYFTVVRARGNKCGRWACQLGTKSARRSISSPPRSGRSARRARWPPLVSVPNPPLESAAWPLLGMRA